MSFINILTVIVDVISALGQADFWHFRREGRRRFVLRIRQRCSTNIN